jgi:CheY-like chemotaxis protein
MVDRLRSGGYEVEKAEGYDTAIALFASAPFKYDVVITDLDLKTSGRRDGEQLVASLIERRETRGYGPAPEFICITGAALKRDPRLKNTLQKRGCQFVLKGTDQYFLETQAAELRLREIRSSGPELLFKHHSAQRYGWEDNKDWDCAAGEDVEGIYFIQAGEKLPIRIAPAPRRLLDFLARRAWRRPFSVDETASSMSLSPFYSYWSDDKIITADSVKNNVRRIRVALESFFRANKLPYNADQILLTVTNDNLVDANLDSSKYGQLRPISAARTDELITPFEVFEGYKFVARSIVEHIP